MEPGRVRTRALASRVPPASSPRAIPLRELPLPRDPRAVRRPPRGLRSSRVREGLLPAPAARARSAYAWHTDRGKGQRIVRFQIPLVTDRSAFLLTTDYSAVDELRGVSRCRSTRRRSEHPTLREREPEDGIVRNGAPVDEVLDDVVVRAKREDRRHDLQIGERLLRERAPDLGHVANRPTRQPPET